MTDNEYRVEYHEELDEIRASVVRLGALTTEMISRGTDALLAKDLTGAQTLIDSDDELDALTVDIEENVIRLLALQAPMATDLRFLICSLKMASQLERSADLMVNTCKAARRLYDLEWDPRLRGLISSMSEEARSLTGKAIDAYVDGDAALADALDDMDSRLDDLHVDYIEAIFTSHQESDLELRHAVQLALVGRYYERIGDHAVNMGERVSFMVTGWLPEHTGAARIDLRKKRESGGSE